MLARLCAQCECYTAALLHHVIVLLTVWLLDGCSDVLYGCCTRYDGTLEALAVSMRVVVVLLLLPLPKKDRTHPFSCFWQHLIVMHARTHAPPPLHRVCLPALNVDVLQRVVRGRCRPAVVGPWRGATGLDPGRARNRHPHRGGAGARSASVVWRRPRRCGDVQIWVGAHVREDGWTCGCVAAWCRGRARYLVVADGGDVVLGKAGASVAAQCRRGPLRRHLAVV